MATYTADELKTYTSVAAVNGWADTKILIFQTVAESILASLDLDTTVSGYTDAYNSAVILLFDWLCANPSSLQSRREGKVTQTFIRELPVSLQVLLKPFIEGDTGYLTPAILERRDIGRR